MSMAKCRARAHQSPTPCPKTMWRGSGRKRVVLHEFQQPSHEDNRARLSVPEYGLRDAGRVSVPVGHELRHQPKHQRERWEADFGRRLAHQRQVSRRVDPFALGTIQARELPGGSTIAKLAPADAGGEPCEVELVALPKFKRLRYPIRLRFL